MEVKKRNRNADMQLLVSLGTNYAGERFSLMFSVKDYGTAQYVCSYDGTTYTHCVMADDTHVLCKLENHGLGYGLVSVEAKVYRNDSLMDDGNLLSVYRGLAVITVDGRPCHLELTDGKSDDIGLSELAIEMLTAGLLKGDPFRYEDFTPEQIAELQLPATEIAEQVAAAEALRVQAETSRQLAESLREEHEGVRMSNEAARYQAEAARVTAENARVTAENTRKANEIARQANEATRQANELARQAYEYKVFGDYAGVTRVLGYNETKAFIADGSGGVYTVQQASGPGMTKPVLLKKGDTFYMEHDKAKLFTLTLDNTELHQGDIINLAADNIGGSVTYTATENCWVTASCGLAEDEEYFIIDGENCDSYVTKKSLYAMEVNNISYDSTRKKIQMLHDTSVIAELDATPFIKDGMVESVEIINGNLVITFNTASGKEPISIPISDIFDASNYYTKGQTDALLSGKEVKSNKVTSIGGSSTDTQYPSAKAVNTALNSKLDKEFVIAEQVPIEGTGAIVWSALAPDTTDLGPALLAEAAYETQVLSQPRWLKAGTEVIMQGTTGRYLVKVLSGDELSVGQVCWIVSDFDTFSSDYCVVPEDGYYCVGYKSAIYANYITFSRTLNVRNTIEGLEEEVARQGTAKEDKSNKVTSISGSSTDTQYPSAKAVNTALSNKADKSNAVIGVQFDEDENCLVVNKNGTLTEVGMGGIKAQGDNVAAEYRSPFSSTYTQDVQSGFEQITSDVMRLNENKEDKANKVTEIDDDSTDTQYPSAKGVWTAIKNAITAIKQWATSLFARTDGYYSRMIIGGAESLIGDVPQTATYTFRRTGGGAIGEPVARLTEIQGNTGVVNQLFRQPTPVTANGITATYDATTGILTMSGTSGTGSFANFGQLLDKFVSGHIYYFKSRVVANPNNIANVRIVPLNQSVASYEEWIFTAISTNSGWGFSSTTPNTDYTGVQVAFQYRDLTLMYGSGNEPGTVDEFAARIWRDYGKTLDEYIAYTTGKLINCKTLALESVGQNQWDEEWELGLYNETTGQKQPYAQAIRCANYISVLPATQYCFRKAPANPVRFLFYDRQHTLVDTWTAQTGNTINLFTTPADAVYMTFHINALTTYNHDICINLSDAAINGTYRPYWKEVTNLNLTTLTGINPTTGVRETIFPNGMGGGDGWRSALREVNGAVVAEVNTARVNLGDFTYTQYNTTSQKKRWGIALQDAQAPADNTTRANIKCSKYATTTASNIYNEVQGVAISNTHLFQIYDNALQTTAADVKAAMDGVFLEYQLAEPIIYTDLQYADGTPFVLPTNFEVQNGGTERITHAEGEDSIAPVMSAIYGLNAVGFVQDAPKDYTSSASLDSLVSVLSSITGRTISKTWSDAQNKWIYTSN